MPLAERNRDPWPGRRISNGAVAAGTVPFLAGALLVVGLPPASGQSAAIQPRVVDVPSRPAFVRPPGTREQPARAGQPLPGSSLLRTQRPGRMQVQLADGRGFRLGGDAMLRLSDDALQLERGEIIAWLKPGTRSSAPLRVRTRVGTASIVGTTLFIEAGPDQVRFLSWEGKVRVDPEDGQPPVILNGAETVVWKGGAWGPRTRLSPEEARTRRRASRLLNGFAQPMETLPLVERTLQEVSASGPAEASSGPIR